MSSPNTTVKSSYVLNTGLKVETSCAHPAINIRFVNFVSPLLSLRENKTGDESNFIARFVCFVCRARHRMTRLCGASALGSIVVERLSHASQSATLSLPEW
jgi:hypothetical protein